MANVWTDSLPANVHLFVVRDFSCSKHLCFLIDALFHQEGREITVKGGCKFDVAKHMTPDDILEAFALSIREPSRTASSQHVHMTEVIVKKDDKVQHKTLLTYERLDPKTEYSVEVLTPASSSAQASGEQ
eukprot:4112128-Amphidinium_carterae.1